MKYHFTFLFVLFLLILNVINAKYINTSSNDDEVSDDEVSVDIYSDNDLDNDSYEEPTQEIIINYRFADAEEAAELLLSHHEYYDIMNQNNLNYRVQKLNATLEEMKEKVRQEVLDLNDKDKKAVDNAVNAIKKICVERGYTLPPIDDIVFAKTTTKEECDAGAYTLGNEIYIGSYYYDQVHANEDEEKNDVQFFNGIVAHEIFHTLTRSNPDFRKDMYNILGFTVVDKDYDFPKEVSDLIFLNPDVEHHDSYATFNINGEDKKCVVIFTVSKPFEEPGDIFYHYENPCLVPIDDLNTVYNRDDAKNYDEVFGINYNSDPEEALAQYFNYVFFSYTPGQEDEEEYLPDPENEEDEALVMEIMKKREMRKTYNKIIKNIDSYLKSSKY